MSKGIKRALGIVGVILTIVVVTTILLKNVKNSDTQVQLAEDSKLSKMRYAIVNEDVGGNYGNKRYGLGIDFVSLVSQEGDASWTNVPRNIAEAGIDDGSFDAYIIIPQDFSQKLLDLKSLDPDKATIKYKVRSGKNETVNLKMNNLVTNVLSGFNQRIINMYFSTVLGHVQDAQLGVEKIADLQGGTIVYANDKVVVPFTEVPEDFKGIQSYSDGLVDKQKSFMGEVSDLADGSKKYASDTNNSLKKLNESVSLYKNLQKEDSQKNLDDIQKIFEDRRASNKRELDDIQKSLLEQDKDNKDDLSTYYTSMKDDLNVLAKNDDNLLTQLTKEVNDADDKVKNAAKQVTEISSQGQALKTDLTGSLSSINNTFFNGRDANQASDEDVKTSLIKGVFGGREEYSLERSLPERYKNQIVNLKSNIPANFKDVLTSLKDEGLLSNYDYEKYLSYYDALAKFDGDFGQDTELGFTNLDEGSTFIGQKQYLTLAAGEEVRLSLRPSKNLGVEVTSGDVENPVESSEPTESTSSELPSSEIPSTDTINSEAVAKQAIESETYPNSEPSYSDSGTSQEGSNSETSSEEVDNGIVEERDGDYIIYKNTSKQRNQLTLTPIYTVLETSQDFSVSAGYTVSGKELGNLNFSQDLFRLNTGSLNRESESQYKIAIANYYKPLSDLSAALSNMDTIYGTGGDNLETYAREVASADDFVSTIKDDSLSKSYSQISILDLEGIINQPEISSYRQEGQVLSDNVNQELTKLDSLMAGEGLGSVEQVNTILNSYSSDEGGMTKTLQNLGSWYESANKLVEDNFKKAQDKDTYKVKNDESEAEKFDKGAGNVDSSSEVTSQIDGLMSTSKGMADSVADNQIKVSDLSDEFKGLKDGTKKVQTNTENVLTNVKELNKSIGKQESDGKDFAKNLRDSLANTRNGGSDNDKYIDFLSNPVAMNNESTHTKTIQSILPYLLTIASTGLVFLVNFLTRKLTDGYKLLVLSLTSLVFSIMEKLLNLNGLGTLLTVIIYNLLVFLGLWLILNMGNLKFRRFTYFLLTFLIIIYLITNSVLGVAGLNNNFENLLRLNPFNLIEEGYESVILKDRIMTLSYIITGILAGIFIALAYYHYKKENRTNVDLDEDKV